MEQCSNCKEVALTKLKEKRQRCEVYSRVTGYLRPVRQWNDGKQSEFMDRKLFNIAGEISSGQPEPAGV